MVSQTQSHDPPLLPSSNINNPTVAKGAGDFAVDPFGDDPFVTEDPFAEADFSKQDPFETEFSDFKNKTPVIINAENSLKSTRNQMLDRQMSMISTSPRNVQFNKQNTFDVHFEKYESRREGSKLMQMHHENPSLDISSESECAPEPPPRPASTLMQIKPPPLPPKKYTNDLTVKPPPRPPHTDDSHYDYMDNYETAPNSLEFIKNSEISPPLPVPARKSRFESDFAPAPERPKKHFNVQSSDEDYLTPISFPHEERVEKVKSPVLLPPPQKSGNRKQNVATVASYLESKPNVTTTTASENLNCSLEGLDITLSQLTLSGLNELAAKLNIPTNQLSNMTLVQLTNYLSNFIKSKSNEPASQSNDNIVETNGNEFPAFKADFAANFGHTRGPTVDLDTYDKYAVFRELITEEIKQTKIDTEPEQIREENEIKEKNSTVADVNVNDVKITESESNSDKYAALREIVEKELKVTETEQENDNRDETEVKTMQEEKDMLNEEEVKETNIINLENKFNVEDEKSKLNIIEYNTPLDNKDLKAVSPLKLPKSPVDKGNNIIKSPVPVAITKIMQNSARLTSGSLSDVVSGSSPEVDNTASNSEVGKKVGDAAGNLLLYLFRLGLCTT